MKAYWISPGAAGTHVELRDTPAPEPKAGEILVRVRAASLNRGELLGAAHGAAPKPGGGECAGEVVKVGDGVNGIPVGARMLGRCGGGFAELALMDAREVLRVPERLTWEEAAATPLTFIVAYDMLIAQGHLTAGQWLSSPPSRRGSAWPRSRPARRSARASSAPPARPRSWPGSRSSGSISASARGPAISTTPS